ncbi:hypothetical protein BDN70DRAFT_362759 [Pholiota conissans]|uniref:ubiquitinyl hydrolase 1 n=1 Tax=Pholiota conissans TaxID=109636 RepID=A0A9P5YRB1_9AGAR|nr:hypothetical protein BDN70DRAFT_362759 [Pholiota conissans]
MSTISYTRFLHPHPVTAMGTEINSVEDLHYTLNHVFLPPKLPQNNDDLLQNINGDVTLCKLAYEAALLFPEHLPERERAHWRSVIKMLRNLIDSVDPNRGFAAKDELAKTISGLEDKDALALHIRAQNACLIIRRIGNETIFEAFKVSPPPEAIMGIEGKIVCMYPGPAVKIPLSVAQDRFFVNQLVNFLSHMDVDELDDAVATTTKAGSTVQETRGATHPRYITELLIAILQGIGETADVKRITKRIADDVCWNNAQKPWRRSPIWLIARVAAQTTSESREIYKAWMLFLHSRLLQTFLERDFSSDLLHTARVKTAKRAFKLRDSAPPSLIQFVQEVCDAVQKRLEQRWAEEQQLQSFSPSYFPDRSAIERDTALTLTYSRPYLTKVMHPDAHNRNSAPFYPSHQLRLRDRGFDAIFPDGLTKAVEAEPYIALADFEYLVQEGLSDWASNHINDPSACESLGSCLDQYISAAKAQYISNAEDRSLMFLTILDLWVALDKIACSQEPLLLAYSPAIPASILGPILIRHAISLDRVSRIERYIRRRHVNADSASNSIFSSELTAKSFSVRYYRESPYLQTIKSSIEASATAARIAKEVELESLNAEHTSLLAQAARMNCTFFDAVDRWGNVEPKHLYYRCGKCITLNRADELRISIHEWPLPRHTFEAEAVVFELNCPLAFSVWRTHTYQILRDLGMAEFHSKSTTAHTLSGYDGLKKWTTTRDWGRIVLASNAKSFLKSHYRSVGIPAQASHVCVNNGFSFKLYDTNKGEMVLSSFNIDLRQHCTLRLSDAQEDLYRHLQYAVNDTSHSHNSTIVTQGDCPASLSIHEQLAFSNLRCGPRLQWMNILRELRTRILSFSSEDVHILLTQAAWQIGPLSRDESTRTWHYELESAEFGSALISEAKDLLSNVESNWMEINTVKSIVYLISRLFSSTSDSQVQEMGYALLKKARAVAHKWMRQILCKLRDIVEDDNSIRDLQRRVCEAAATCRATFDVDSHIHLDALMSSSADVAILIECAIVIHDNAKHRSRKSLPDFDRFLQRDHRLSHRLELGVLAWIQSDRYSLDAAIISVWPMYRPGDKCWQRLPQPNSRWVTSFTASLSNQRVQHVYYNILSGQLVIDGKLLGRLPQEITGHPTYERILGQNILDVIPADMDGMDYATRSLVNEHQLFFAFRDNAAIIRARTRSGQTFELIPHDVFAKDFPFPFSTDYVHWMDVSTGKIEFRRHDRLWQHCSSNWYLHFQPAGLSRMSLGNGGSKLQVDIQSETFRGAAARLCPLESAEYLVVTTSAEQSYVSVTVELPRFRLSFSLTAAGELESNNMHGMIIDSDQCAGTMVGLTTQLVLRRKEAMSASLPRSRIVIIPYGKVRYSISPSTNHVRVHINTQLQARVTWYKYEIDTDLGKLVGSVNLTSRLFRLYLHALTSHPLPDPLTSQRGTDLALQELAAGASFSFQQLTRNNIELLRLIGEITPKREYYPKHLNVMQMTTWSPFLPVLSQHGGFDLAASEIMRYAHSLTVFPELYSEKFDYECIGDPLLTTRAKRRNSVYYECPTTSSSESDKLYHSRDGTDNPDGAVQALNTSRLIYAWRVGFAVNHSAPSALLETFEKWGVVQGVEPSCVSLQYSKEWLHLDLRTKWLSVYELCREIEQPQSKFDLLFSFSSLAYSGHQSFQAHIMELLAVATLNPSLQKEPPRYSSFDLARGYEPLSKSVQMMIASKVRDFDDSPAFELPRLPCGEKPKAFQARLTKIYMETIKLKIDDAVDCLMRQWSSPSEGTPLHELDLLWFRTDDLDDIREYFANCSRNSALRTFTSGVSNVIRNNILPSPLTGRITSGFQTFTPSRFKHDHPPWNESLTLEDLLSSRKPPDLTHSSHQFGFKAEYASVTSDINQQIDTTALENLLEKFKRNHTTALHHIYHSRLQESQKELRGCQMSILPQELEPRMDACIVYRENCCTRLSHLFSRILASLRPSTPTEQILNCSGMWPPISQRTILQQLLSSSRNIQSAGWTEFLIVFAEAFIEYQHSQRLVEFCHRKDFINFAKEAENATFNYSDASRYPEWLLIQIDGNFAVRPIQSQVAREMISPTSNKNMVLQLNMGEGKSHVIIPLAAATLADSHKLVRIVVLKPLAKQMFQLLVERLSGLVNRRIFYLPFCRDVKANAETIANIRNLFENCARVRGILVAQPEHILSFRLMVIDRILSSKGLNRSQVVRDLIATQTWLHSNSRDVLDESDELLHIRFQLIYTMDQQQSIDNGPDRWVTTQRIFDVVRRHMWNLQKEFPEDVELVERHNSMDDGRFPHFRLLGVAAWHMLSSNIANDALNGMLENLNFIGLGSKSSLRSNVFDFITVKTIGRQSYHAVKDVYEATALWKGLLLLRGLLAHGILVYALSRRRWRVDYGLDARRSLLAVPYRAKDVPSLRSEFGHPDVVICLTCLSYYYGGLSPAQVHESFELVAKLDNPSLEYESWVRRGGAAIPSAIRQLIGVNMKDVDAFTRNVIPFFQHNKGTIDFYLSQVVFPKEAKEFPSKLGTSGWDLAESKTNFTTGFSGTNDNADLLPISISQTDPVNQLRTNAQVVGYLLRSENNRYICIEGRDGGPCSAAELLDIVINESKEIRVLLDVGAQMLELTNRQVVEYWLSRTPHDAAVFFDESDNMSVLCDGTVEPLHSSPFLQRLHQCIIYLDDAHTRGTDLRLPPDFHALVTLGPKVTKDKLVQGCMRMRNLGHGQSIAFCAPPEVDRHIRRLENIDPCAAVQVADVLSWAMSNTCTDIRDHAPHWVQQGVYYHQRRSRFSSSQEGNVRMLRTTWLEPAARTLEEMYGHHTKSSSMMDLVKDIPAMTDRLKMLGLTKISSEAVAEEQEREVSHEVEEESQLERPPTVPAAEHKLNEEIRTFVRYGNIAAGSQIFLPLMAPLCSKSEKPSLRNPWSKQLLGTRDFRTTTMAGKERTTLTEYLRPVNWIVSRIRNGDILLVVMSPYEVNAILEEIRRSKHVRLHVYAPRTSESMKPFDLAFYCIPPLHHGPMIPATLTNDIGHQLNIWAGQLYLDSYESYLRLCLILGISSSESDGNSRVESDRFVSKARRSKEMSEVCLFDKSPLPLLKVLFGLRRKGMSFQSTHMGKILQARLLTPKDFED